MSHPREVLAMFDVQPDFNASIQEFVDDYETTRPRSLWRTGRCGLDDEIETDYISYRTLEQNLTLDKVERLLEALFENWRRPAPDAHKVMEYHLRSFAILLCIGEGRLIHHFTEHQTTLNDQFLPFYQQPLHFPTSTTRRDLFQAFSDTQWRFCPRRLEWNMSYTLEKDEILPINHKEEIQDGGSGVVWKIKVDADYDSLAAQDNKENTSHSDQHTYVIKTYRTKEARGYYDTEREAFKRLRWDGKPPLNIIIFHGSFVRENKYNIILEYADWGSLNNFMQHNPPPRTAEERHIFWSRLLKIIMGLVRVHNQDERKEGLQIFHGWHQDVHPGNILVKSRGADSKYDCDFKLADLGLSHFKLHDPSVGITTDRDTFGTSGYGPPETQRSDPELETCKLKVKQDVDIFSLGCILSELATWINHGWDGLEEYRRRRADEVAKTRSREDCFHNGHDLLSTVYEANDDTIYNSHRSDHITPRVVKELVIPMLSIGKERPQAKSLYDRSLKILEKPVIKQIVPSLDKCQSWSGESSHSTPPRCEGGLPFRSEHPQTNNDGHAVDAYYQGDHPSDLDFHNRVHLTSGMISPNPYGHPQANGYGHGANNHHNTELWRDSHFHNPRPVLGGDYGHGVGTLHSADFWRDSHFQNHRPVSGGNYPSDRRGVQTRRSIQYHPQYNGLSTQYGSGRTNLGAPFSSHDIHDQQQYEVMNRPDHSFNRHSDLYMSGPSEMMRPQPLVLQSKEVNRGEQAEMRNAQNEIRRKPPPPQQPQNLPILPMRSKSHVKGKSKQPHPEMSVDVGLSYLGTGSIRNFPCQELLEDLNGRDHAFLIDNSESMRPYRSQVRNVLQLLAFMVHPADPDGLDVYFTTERKKVRPKGIPTLLREFDKRTNSGTPDMRDRFASIIEAYQSNFGKRNTLSRIIHPRSTPKFGPRRLTLYVLTDGVWQPNSTLVTEIETLVNCLWEHKLTNKQVGIQFVRFGDSAEGIRRLNKLDSKMKLRLDIVDTTPADGNVWKMLRGAINDWADDDSVEDSDEDVRAKV